MKLYPAIDLCNGKCVRLYKGDYNSITEYGDPVTQALRWKNEGASFLHLVDLDGAKEGKSINLDSVKEIIEKVNIDVELGGGIRTIDHIKKILSIGVKRVILGSSALNIEFVKEAINLFGSEKIVVGIDCKNMKVATHGWLNVSSIDAIEFAKKLKNVGVKTIIFTDISKDGTLEGINLEETKALIEETNLNVIASGGAKTIDDIKNAKDIGAKGVILGKSLYQGSINLSLAIKLYED